MGMWSFIKRFGKYPPNYFSNRLKSIITKLIESIKNSGNSVFRFTLIFPLILCIAILQVLLIIKYFFKNIIEFISFIIRLIRKVFIVLLEELEFYWTILRNLSKKVVDNLKVINKKLLEIIDYQLKKLGNDTAIYITEYGHISGFELIISSISYLVLTIIWIVFGTVMSIGLIVGTAIIIVPFLHQMIRIKLFKFEMDQNEYDS